MRSERLRNTSQVPEGITIPTLRAETVDNSPFSLVGQGILADLHLSMHSALFMAGAHGTAVCSVTGRV